MHQGGLMRCGLDPALPLIALPAVRSRESGGLDHRLLAHVGHGIVQPGRLHATIVPLVGVAHQRVGLLAEDAYDRFAGEAGFLWVHGVHEPATMSCCNCITLIMRDLRGSGEHLSRAAQLPFRDGSRAGRCRLNAFFFAPPLQLRASLRSDPVLSRGRVSTAKLRPYQPGCGGSRCLRRAARLDHRPPLCADPSPAAQDRDLAEEVWRQIDVVEASHVSGGIDFAQTDGRHDGTSSSEDDPR